MPLTELFPTHFRDLISKVRVVVLVQTFGASLAYTDDVCFLLHCPVKSLGRGVGR